MSALLDAARWYASRGIPVLPLHTPRPGGRCSCRRPDCDRAGKHPRLRHGLNDASTDPARLDLWWAKWPAANVGLCTGTVMDVLDIDSAAGRAAVQGLRIGAGPLARTGSGGWHLWLRPTGDGNRVRLLPGVDWRGAGGYVVAPPSLHARGERYRWYRSPDTPLPSCPPALRDLVAGPPTLRDRTASPPAMRDPVAGPPRAPEVGPAEAGAPGRGPDGRPVRHPVRYAAAALAAATHRVGTAPVGQRNDTLNRAAYALGRLVAAGLLDGGTVAAELTAAARRAGLGTAEVARTLRSGLTAGYHAA